MTRSPIRGIVIGLPISLVLWAAIALFTVNVLARQ